MTIMRGDEYDDARMPAASTPSAAIKVGDVIPIRFVGVPGLTAEGAVTAIRDGQIDYVYTATSEIFAGLRGSIRMTREQKAAAE